ncbi:MAG: alpha-glucosidase family protein [Rickettsiales bacterium]|nr:alpha-glucosidase family protein [Rickettsiales bacterium]
MVKFEVGMMTNDWWRGGLIYQVYPRSYMDTNGDGIGDIPGITQQLDYIASLGVDAVWISPFFTSPMKDFGYDVSNFKDVDPMFGTLSDFEALIDKARTLGLRVMIDLVLSHSSDQHPWFIESRSSRTNAKADWYVWANPKPDGTPPNNWLSVFGGSAWEWDTKRRQYYLHNFLTCQPDLNFHQPAVRQALLEVTEFWLKMGVQGFRLDTVNFYFHDKELRDNPVNDGPPLDNVPESNPYSMQTHVYDITRPENLGFLEEFRQLLDRYPDTAAVGEMGAEKSYLLIPDYTERDQRLHMVYTFRFLNDNFSVDYFRSYLTLLEDNIRDGWACFAFSNHDVMRAVQRWSPHHPELHDDFARMLLALITSLRGSLCLYQGEELGLPEAEIAFEQLQDPYGIRFWPEFKGRDGCRTPMPWRDAPHGAFTQGKPWLPVPEAHQRRSVETQEQDASSLLHHYRAFIAWRNNQPTLRSGDIRFVDVAEPLLAFERSEGTDKILCIFNFSATVQTMELPSDARALTDVPSMTDQTMDGRRLTLKPYDYFYAWVS